jgi:hypothetical protein
MKWQKHIDEHVQQLQPFVVLQLGQGCLSAISQDGGDAQVEGVWCGDDDGRRHRQESWTFPNKQKWLHTLGNWSNIKHKKIYSMHVHSYNR